MRWDQQPRKTRRSDPNPVADVEATLQACDLSHQGGKGDAR